MATIKATFGNLRVYETLGFVQGCFLAEEEPKWVAFCKSHGFDARRDVYADNGHYTKYYDLYLRLCAEKLV